MYLTKAACGTDVHLAADLTNAEHHLHDPAQFGFGGDVAWELLGRRPGRQHDAGAAYAGQRRDAQPDVLGNEGHQRMQRPQQRFQHLQQGAAGGLLRGRIGGLLQHRFDDLQVPVAVLVPGELVERAGGEIEAVFVKRAVDRADRVAEARSARRR